MAAAHPFGAFVGCRFKRIGFAHFARLQETTSQYAVTLCHAVFCMLRLPALPCPASACVAMCARPYSCTFRYLLRSLWNDCKVNTWCEVAVYPKCNAILLQIWHYFKACGLPCSDIFQLSPPPQKL